MKKFYLALFHFHQADEKALKAFLYLKLEATEIFYMHSIMNLLKMAIQVDSEVEKVKSSKNLDQYYISTRYPNGLLRGVPSLFYDEPNEAESAMILVKNIIKILKKIKI